VQVLMDFIDASKLAEFLDDNKGKNLDRHALRTETELLNKAGLPVSEKDRKSRKTIRALEYFLLRSGLYRCEGENLVPSLVSEHWRDYAKAWKTTIDGKEVHLPFLGKIAFLCNINGTKRIKCHPETTAEIEKICVDIGALTFQRNPDEMYKLKTCQQILDNYTHKQLTDDFLLSLKDTPFGRALVSLDLARKTGSSFTIEGDGLLLTELKRTRGDDDLEKITRLILEREQTRQAQIASTIVCLEYLERHKTPSENVVGYGPRYKERKRAKKRQERLDYFQAIEDICSIDARVASNMLATKGDRSPGFAAFGSFFDTYHRIEGKAGTDWIENFSFLSWYTDCLSYLAFEHEGLYDRMDWPDVKILKTRKHRAFLSRFVHHNLLNIVSRKDLAALQSKCSMSEFIDMNVDLKRIPTSDYFGDSYCPSNVFALSKVPVDRELFRSSVLNILQSSSRLKDPQGAFYYPDFRFLAASTLSISLRTVDQILAYVISTDSDLGRRLWFFPAFGRVPRRDRPDQQLTDIVLKPFDSITLNY
jgi:hypothetical protein